MLAVTDATNHVPDATTRVPAANRASAGNFPSHSVHRLGADNGEVWGGGGRCGGCQNHIWGGGTFICTKCHLKCHDSCNETPALWKEIKESFKSARLKLKSAYIDDTPEFQRYQEAATKITKYERSTKCSKCLEALAQAQAQVQNMDSPPQTSPDPGGRRLSMLHVRNGHATKTPWDQGGDQGGDGSTGSAGGDSENDAGTGSSGGQGGDGSAGAGGAGAGGDLGNVASGELSVRPRSAREASAPPLATEPTPRKCLGQLRDFRGKETGICNELIYPSRSLDAHGQPKYEHNSGWFCELHCNLSLKEQVKKNKKRATVETHGGHRSRRAGTARRRHVRGVRSRC